MIVRAVSKASVSCMETHRMRPFNWAPYVGLKPAVLKSCTVPTFLEFFVFYTHTRANMEMPHSASHWTKQSTWRTGLVCDWKVTARWHAPSGALPTSASAKCSTLTTLHRRDMGGCQRYFLRSYGEARHTTFHSWPDGELQWSLTAVPDTFSPWPHC